MRGAKRNGGLTSFFYRERAARPASRSEVEAPVEISAPTNFKRDGHISYRAATGLFSGLDTPVALFFGVPISSQPRVEVEGYKERIPSILVLLTKELIHRGGLKEEGIFRVNGESTSVQRSKAALNAGRGMPALEGDLSPHLFASLIKDWFRSLELNVLQVITEEAMAELAMDTLDNETTYCTVKETLTEPYRSIFCWLIDLLAIVCTHKDANLMSPQAMATVFAPTLFASEIALESYGILKNVNKVIEKCIQATLERGDLERKEQVFGA